MSMMNDAKTDKSVEKEGDFLGGYSPFESGLVKFKIKLAFLTKSAKKALALNLHLEAEDKRLLKQVIYFTSNEKKGCKTFYEKEGKKYNLPGFSQVAALAKLTVGKDFISLPETIKTINLYDFNQKKEIPTKVEMLMDLLGQEISCGVVKQIVDVKSYHEGTKTYVATGKTRIENEINKMFHAGSGLTLTEIDAGMEKPVFQEKWAAKWDGITLDKSTAPKGGANKAKSSDGMAGSGDAAPNTNLFD